MCFGELGHSHEKTKRKAKKILFQKIAAKKIFEKKKTKKHVFVKYECPRNTHLMRNTTLILDLDLCI